jgi:L-alanine-DL-glutamate epimerase-like enolase superfamily enzyme
MRSDSRQPPSVTLRHQPLDLRLRHTFRIARGASDVRENLLIEAESAGLVGRGEAAPILRYGEDRASPRRPDVSR